MRKKGLLFLSVLFILSCLLFLLLSDRWLERRMELFGSSIVGAKVEFDGVDFSLLDLSMKWDSLQVTNPDNTWRNLFETGQAEFDFDVLPLVSKKYIIEKLEVGGLRFDTPRRTDGKIDIATTATVESKVVNLIKEKLREESADIPAFNLKQFGKKINVDSVWNLVDLKTPRKTDSLKNLYELKYQHWEKRIASLPSENELQVYRREVESIKIDQIKTIDDFQKAFSEANIIYKQVDSLYKGVSDLKIDFERDVSGVRDHQKQLSEWIKKDYQRALSLAQVPDISVQKVAKLLFGQRIIGGMQRILGYIGKARYYSEKIKSSSPEKESPPRLKGQDIYFGPKNNLPKFWIKKLSISGEAWNGMQISGNVLNIVSRQKVIDAPTSFILKGTRRDQASLSLDITLDYREEVPREKIDLKVQQIPISNVKLTDSPLLPYKLEKGRAEIRLNMDFLGPDLSTDIQFTGRNLKFDYSEKPTDVNERLRRMSRSIMESLDLITLEAKVKKTEKKYSFFMSSNLDNLIAGKFKSLLTEEVDQTKREIEKRVNQEIKKYQDELTSFIAQNEQQLRLKLENVEKEVEKQKSMITEKQKEIEKKIEEEKNKILKQKEKEGKKILQDLFKK